MKASKKLSLPIILAIVVALVIAITCGMAIATEGGQPTSDDVWRGYAAMADEEAGDDATLAADAASNAGSADDQAAGDADGDGEMAVDGDEAVNPADGDAAEGEGDEAADGSEAVGDGEDNAGDGAAEPEAVEGDEGTEAEAAEEVDEETVELMAEPKYQTVSFQVYLNSNGSGGDYPLSIYADLYSNNGDWSSYTNQTAYSDGPITVTLPAMCDVSDTSKGYNSWVYAMDQYGNRDWTWVVANSSPGSSYVYSQFNEDGQLVFPGTNQPFYVRLVKMAPSVGSGISGGGSGVGPVVPDGSGASGSGAGGGDGADPIPVPGPEPIDITATKVWDDSDNAAGVRDTVTLHLQSKVGDAEFADVPDGTQTIAANATGDALTVTWEDMPVTDEDGATIQYQVVEDEIANYKTSISGDYEDGFTVTNTLDLPDGEESGDSGMDIGPEPNAGPEDSEEASASAVMSGDEPNSANGDPDDEKASKKSKSPKTGDAGLLAICGAVVLLAAGAAVTTVAGRRRSREDDEE